LTIMKIILLTISLFVWTIGVTQNLIMNPSFEEYYECPLGTIGVTTQISKCKNVFSPWCANGSAQNCFVKQPHYFNACADYNSGANVPHIYIHNVGSNIIFGHRNAKDVNAFISLRND